jgi:putative FmdB family regulatory protein
MPLYDYLCTECGERYDVFHRTTAGAEDIICPSCGSTNHRRLFSVVSVSTKSTSSDELGACAAEERGGECCGGRCAMN